MTERTKHITNFHEAAEAVLELCSKPGMLELREKVLALMDCGSELIRDVHGLEGENLQKDRELMQYRSETYQPIYGPTEHSMEYYFAEKQHALFAQKLLIEIGERYLHVYETRGRKQWNKGLYKEIAAVLVIMEDMKWFKSVYHCQNDDSIFWTILNKIMHMLPEPLIADSCNKAIARWRKGMTPQDVKEQREAMCKKYEDYLQAA